MTVPRSSNHLISLLLRSVSYTAFVRAYSTQTEQSKNMEYTASSQYIKWDSVGFSIVGRLISYKQKPNNLNNGKLQGEIELKTKDGVRLASCPTALDKIMSEHHEALTGKAIKITFTGLQTHKADGTKFMQPMKQFKVEDASQKAAPAPEPDVNDTGDDIPF